jgi:uncharacterized protein (TIGR00251 family)
MTWIRQNSNGISIALSIAPRASRSQIEGIHGDALKARLAAPPVDGKANRELVGLLAETLRVPRNAVTIEAGAKSRHKVVFVSGLSVEEACARLKLQPPP